MAPKLTGRRLGGIDLDTEVPTPAGITTVAALKAGSSVFGADGRPVTVAEAPEPELAERCFEVEFATGDRVSADAQLRWLAERRDGRRPSFIPARRPTAELAGDVARFGPASLAVRVAEPVQLPDRRLPFDPYVLGVWLAIGHANAAGTIGASDALVRSLCDRGVRVFASGVAGQHWIGLPQNALRRGADLTSKLRGLGLLDEKHVPMDYLRAGERQRRDLLAGLLDAGGGVSDGGEVVYRARNLATASGVHQLVASLGMRAWSRPGAAGGIDVGFISDGRVFGLSEMHRLQRSRRRPSTQIRPRRLVVGVSEVPARAVRRLRVASDDGMMLVTRSFIPVSGAVLEEAEELSSLA